MTTHEYLGQLRMIDYEIMAIGSETQSLRDIATNMHKNYDDILVDKSPNPGRTEDIIIKIVDSERKADKKREALITMKLHIEDQIKGIGNRCFYTLLWLIYHDDKRLHEVAKIVNYTEKHTRRLIQKAETAFEKKYGDEYMTKKVP